MSGTAVLVIAGAMAFGGVWLGVKVLAAKLMVWAAVALVVGAALFVVVWAVWRLAVQVFSFHGLAYSLGFVEATWGTSVLAWPTAVQTTTLTLLVEIAVVISMMLDYWQGRAGDYFVL